MQDHPKSVSKMRTILSVLFVSIVAGAYAYGGIHDYKYSEYKTPETKYGDYRYGTYKYGEYKGPDYKSPEYKSPEYKDPQYKPTEYKYGDYKYADKDFVYRQSLLFELLQHPYQPGVSIYKPEYLNIVNSFNFEQSYDYFHNVDAVKEFNYFYQKGLIPYNELFSIYNDNHRRQAIALFHVFYYAKDWDTFYKTILWARYNVNPGLFVYSLHVAILHREDFAGYELPAIYEIFPHYFFSFDVIQRAQLYKQQGFHGIKKVDGVYNVVLYANYSGYNYYSHDDQYISYFTEDIGLNAYYYYFHIDYPFWMGGEQYGLNKDRRGEYYLFFHQQLLARYYLERLSHDYGYIKDFSWFSNIQAYYPNIATYYGYRFASRGGEYSMYHEQTHYDIDYIVAYEDRLLDAIDSGYFLMENGTYFHFGYPGGIEYLGNLIQGNPDSFNVRYYNYMYYVYKTFGKYFGKYYNYEANVLPNVLYHPGTTLRDPVYWMFLKRVFMFYSKFMGQLTPYTYKEIGYEGVHIESVDIDKLITYFDYFDADITNAVDVGYYSQDKMTDFYRYGRVSQYNGEDFVIKARQRRLNHLPFTVRMSVNSQVATPSVVRIFLGPKYDEYGNLLTLNDNRYNFVLLDQFKYDLTVGSNSITRDSKQFLMTVKDRTTYYELYKYVMLSSVGQYKYQMNNYEAHSGYPNRLLLPMGKKGGQTYQLYVHVSPYYAPATPQYSTYDQTLSVGIGSGSRYIDTLPFGYPLDRYIDEYYWYTPNMYYGDVTIYHKTDF